MLMRRQSGQPWWIAGGSDVCAFCGQTYAHEMERRCAGCDAAMCSVCAARNAANQTACPDCKQSPSEL